MKYHKMPLVVFIMLGVGISSARPVQTQQPPLLVAEAGRAVPASRGGGAQAFQITSAILKETRRILVLLPASYSQSAPDRRYPVTVVVDGEYLMAPVAAVSDELSRNGQIPESVIVGIENVVGADWLSSNKKRVYDLTPPGLSVSGSGLNEGGDRFLDFIEQELLPAIDRQFRGAAPRAFVGVSSGGILATYVAATRSTYSAVVSLDAPVHLGDNWLARKMTERAAVPLSPLRYASLEAKFGWPDAAWKTLVAKAPASWNLYREKLQLEGHESMQMLGAYLGLRQVFKDYSRFTAPESPTTSILPYYAKVSASLGAGVFPPKKLLQNVVEDLLTEGRGAAAREAYKTLVSGYGAPADGAKLLARIAEVERRLAPAETVESLLATPFPTPEEARAYIGEWVGDVWMNPGEPRSGKITLKIEVVNGRVIGESARRDTPDGELAQRWQYLKITPTGMTWGFMNGMRPRGVILFEGALEGDTLAGKSRFGGIDFRLPDGSSAPSPSFSFKKAPSQESDRSRKRDEWQRPAEVMDALAVKPGHRVADIGCGFGYFTFRLAARVGAEGKVYAVDIDEEAIDKVRRRKQLEKLEQVEPIVGESADPRLPNDLDAVLIVDSYHEFREYDRMMQAVFRALKPGGRLVIIDGEGPAGRPRTEYHRLHTIPAELVREEVARNGFVFKESRPGFYDPEYGKKMYFLIFEKPLPDQNSEVQTHCFRILMSCAQRHTPC